MNIDAKRRNFLKALTQTGLMFPFFSSALAKEMRHAREKKKRFVALFTSNCPYSKDWYPQNHPNMRDYGNGALGLPLSEIDGPISRMFGAEFDPFRSRINLIKGLDFVHKPQEHAPHKFLDGGGIHRQPRVTIDQVICESPNFYAHQPIAKSLHFMSPGIPMGPFKTGLSFRKDRSLVGPVENLRTAYTSVFSRSFSNQRVKDFLSGNYRNILKTKVIALEDQRRLEQHIEFLNEYSVRSMGSCDKLELPVNVLEEPWLSEGFVKIIGTAIKCDISRVIVYALSDLGADMRLYNWLPLRQDFGFHTATHTLIPEALEYLSEVQLWHSTVVLKLLKELDEVEDIETGETFLDNSLVFWGSESGVMQNFQSNESPHAVQDMPAFLVGSAGGYFKTGQYLNYQTTGKIKYWYRNDHGDRDDCADNLCRRLEFPEVGKPYNELLISIMLSMGLDPSEWEENGTPGFGIYEPNVLDQYDLGDRRSPIPHIVA